MDSDKFDRIVLDLLYDELDELTRASALRHIEQSSRAKSIFAELRATREVGALPLVEPPDDLEERILAAERDARAARPLKERFGSVVSILASYAMRPQLAMAALLLLMLGSSLIFLRAKPGAHETMQVTERGVPETESESSSAASLPERSSKERKNEQAHGVLRSFRERERTESHGAGAQAELAPPAPPQPPAGLPRGLADPPAEEGRAPSKAASGPSSPYGEAMLAYQEGRYGEAVQRFDDVARTRGSDSQTAALFAARAARRDAGCGSAAARFENVARDHAGTNLGQEAAWLAAECHRELGDVERARTALRTLLDTDDYGERARSVLAALATGTDELAAKAAASDQRTAPPRAAARPAAPAATKPQE